MKKLFLTTLMATMFIGASIISTTASAMEKEEGFVVTTEIKGCDVDMAKYCKNITPGDNRPLLCLLANEDKLSEECQFGILDAALANEMASGALDYAYNSCQADREALCPGLKMGEGRISRCFVANQAKLSESCTGALKKTGLWDVILETAAK